MIDLKNAEVVPESHDDETYGYYIVGGYNFRHPEPFTDKPYLTLEEALDAWLSHYHDQRYAPGWGEMPEEDDAIYLGDAGTKYEGWTREEVLDPENPGT